MTFSEFIEEWRDGGDSICCHTSGSTGNPQEIQLPKKEVENSARRTIEFFRLTPESYLYSCVAPDFIGGKMVAVRGIVLNPDEPRFGYEKPTNRPLEAYDGPKIDLLSVVPSQMEWILDRLDSCDAHGDRLRDKIGAVLIGGSFIPEGLRRRIAESGIEAWESYGMTETASHVALRRIGWPQEGFTPLPGVEISLVEGCLAIDIEGWKRVVTHDIAEIDAEGRFSIVGRSDNVIVTGGNKVFPEDVEARLAGCFPFDFAITWESDDKWGQRVVMIAETEEPDDKEIIKLCKEVLPAHMVPKGVLKGKIPRTPNGKIKRKGSLI